jgi:hypothetical protein
MANFNNYDNNLRSFKRLPARDEKLAAAGTMGNIGNIARIAPLADLGDLSAVAGKSCSLRSLGPTFQLLTPASMM